MSLEIISLFDLTKEGQSALIKKKNKQINRLLSLSKSLDSEISQVMLLSKDPVVYGNILRNTANVDELKKHSTQGVRKLRNILWNKNCPAELLEEYSITSDSTLEILSYISPNMPLDLRKNQLTPTRASKLVEVNGNVGDRVVRAYSLVMNNMWMMDTPEIWSSTIKRAIAGMPSLTIEQSEKIKKSGWSGWKSHAYHPIKKGLDIYGIDLDKLTEIGSSASDLAALESNEFTLSHAKKILNRKHSDPEPNVISAIFDRFGIEAFGDTNRYSGTRYGSAAWLNPALLHIEGIKSSEIEDIKETVLSLGSSEEFWVSFTHLANEWEGSFKQLSLAVKNL